MSGGSPVGVVCLGLATLRNFRGPNCYCFSRVTLLGGTRLSLLDST
jgi:hypothetical protein